MRSRQESLVGNMLLGSHSLWGLMNLKVLRESAHLVAITLVFGLFVSCPRRKNVIKFFRVVSKGILDLVTVCNFMKVFMLFREKSTLLFRNIRLTQRGMLPSISVSTVWMHSKL